MRAWIAAAVLALAACTAKPGSNETAAANGLTSSETAAANGAALVPVTITSANGAHVFRVELASTPAQQQQGLMFRTDLQPDGGMLFHPYPPEGGEPRPANFWMKNTPSTLDIVFIRADGTIARIAENTVPFSEAMVPSGEPVAAVLEVVGGRTAALGIGEGDKVSWPR